MYQHTQFVASIHVCIYIYTYMYTDTFAFIYTICICIYTHPGIYGLKVRGPYQGRTAWTVDLKGVKAVLSSDHHDRDRRSHAKSSPLSGCFYEVHLIL